MAENSVRLCGADRANVYRFDGEFLQMGAGFDLPPEFRNGRRKSQSSRPPQRVRARRA